MKFSNLFLPTLRETPSEAEIVSHQLMLRAGLIRKQASGIYSFLPLGLRVIRKIEQIVREEMDAAGAQELLMSALLPAESYKESGRWEVFGPEMFRLKDRNDRDFCLGPTHEEIFAETVRNDVRSYRALPLILYQIQTKYRDERRPRFGVMRSREFIMKDAYSFDRDRAGLDDSYQKMHTAYKRIFERLKLEYLIVDADSGAMGGSGSQEFTVMSDIGESVIACCLACGYAANEDKAECMAAIKAEGPDVPPLEPVSTPNSHTIAEVTDFLGCKDIDLAKTLLFKADDAYIAAMVRGDRELNEAKLMGYLECSNLEMADEEHVKELTCAEVGFAGPVGLNIRLIVDQELLGSPSLIVGANKTGFHLKNVVPGRDFQAEYADIRKIAEGDSCPHCGKELQLSRGIEVGHIFKLGTKYAEALACNYLDEEGSEHPMVMGSYGIGINRSMAAIIEQNHDENGIIWPMAVAPYQVIVVPVNVQDEKQVEVAESLYKSLKDRGAEVLLDDRNERAGVKFKDADLIGIPIRINVGKKAPEGLVEFKLRCSPEARLLAVDDAVTAALDEINNINKLVI